MENNVRQPTPGTQSAKRSLMSSVERLEQSAERMSLESDIGSEIKKIQQELRRQEGTRSSRRNSHGPAPYNESSRQRSGSSVGHSIVDTNNAARRGGFSPEAYVGSPAPSFQSSLSDMKGLARTATQQTQRSYRSSSSAQESQSEADDIASELSFAGLNFTKPPTPPTSEAAPSRQRRPSSPPPSLARPPLSPVDERDARPSRTSSASSRYHRRPRRPREGSDSRSQQQDFGGDSQLMLAAPVPQSIMRSISNASKNTINYAGSLFRDFDGVHYSPVTLRTLEGYIPDDVDGHSIEVADAKEDHQLDRRSDASGEDISTQPTELEADRKAQEEMEEDLRPPPLNIHGLDIDFDKDEDERIHEKVDIMPATQNELRWVEPPPAENMVYYPAPVPMNLNMPKRLSQNPAHLIAAKRRSQLLGSMPADVRKSALMLNGRSTDDLTKVEEQMDESTSRDKQRQSALKFSKLPPQLRASVFFDHESVPHKFEVKDGSAVATLDNLLDASARAPADHSIEELDLSPDLPSKGHKRGKSSGLSSLFDLKSEGTRSRMSLLPFKKSSAAKVPQQSTSGKTVKDDDPLVEEEDDYASADEHDANGEGQDEDEANGTGEEGDADEEKVADASQHHFPTLEEQYAAGAPTTLLAELQSRKAQLRGRNRTAVTAFPNGMHSTLLQMDEVEQIEKKRRQARKTALAWEDPAASAPAPAIRDDEDVPLAVLFPSKHGLANKAGGGDWDRPLGLIEKRQLEDSEPLSRRRNRLRGVEPNRMPPQAQTQMPSTPVGDEEHSEHEGETLAQRTRRLKSSKALDDAIGGSKINDFGTDMMSHFGTLEGKKSEKAEAAVKMQGGNDPEGETLGQRRRRLQAQGGQQDTARPQLQTSLSLSNILAAAPANTARQTSREPSPNGLVGMNAEAENQRRHQLTLRNQMSSSNLLGTPSVNPRKLERSTSGLVSAQQQTEEARRQAIQDQNVRATTRGLPSPLLGQQQSTFASSPGLLGHSQQRQMERQNQILQHNQHGYVDSRASCQATTPQPQLRQTKSFMSGHFNDGAGGVRASAMPPLNTYNSSSTVTQSMMMPQYHQQPASIYGHPAMGYPQQHLPAMGMMQHPMQQYPMQGMPMQMSPAQLQMMDPLLMSSKQRENIDRWRQSVMH